MLLHRFRVVFRIWNVWRLAFAFQLIKRNDATVRACDKTKNPPKYREPKQGVESKIKYISVSNRFRLHIYFAGIFCARPTVFLFIFTHHSADKRKTETARDQSKNEECEQMIFVA